MSELDGADYDRLSRYNEWHKLMIKADVAAWNKAQLKKGK